MKNALGADATLYEIAPQVPYTSADLNYSTDCRANRGQNDDKARPAISGSVSNMQDYDIVFLGYPIWWEKAPKIINTFLESYNFSGKTIAPLCPKNVSPARFLNGQMPCVRAVYPKAKSEPSPQGRVLTFVLTGQKGYFAPALQPKKVGSDQTSVKRPRLQGLSWWERDFFREGAATRKMTRWLL